LEKLYYEVPPEIWKVIQDLYSDMSSQVKWNGHTSKNFNIKQEVRQGGVLSTHLYKSYINDLPLELEKRGLGLTIGLEYCGSPLCADDIVLMSTDVEEIQTMLDIAYKYSCQHRYNIHPQKSALIKTERNKMKSLTEPVKLGEKPLQTVNQTVHLGIIRANKNETNLNIQEHISIARKTLYSLIPVGLNGKNGLNPVTAYKIYQAYVLPRLLYGLEVLPLNVSQITELKQFHTKTLRCFQSLPVRTATSAVYRLLGALPIEAELHKRQLSLLYSILASKLKNLMERQLTVNKNNPESFFSRIQDILNLYNLPPIYVLVDVLPTKLAWKRGINLSIAKKWTNKLSEEVEGKSTMKLCNRDMLKIHDVHPVWSSLPAVTREVKKAQIKARLLTDTYLLQSDMQRFSKEKDEQKCELCETRPGEFVIFMLSITIEKEDFEVNCLYKTRWDSYPGIGKGEKILFIKKNLPNFLHTFSFY
jgi:hypothetical protein